jgi:hypothetical protein
MADSEAPIEKDAASGTATATEDAPGAEGAATDDTDDTGGTEDPGTSSNGGTTRDADGFDLRAIVKQFTAPMIESLDARLREQVEAHADALMDEKVDAAVSDRLATIERAIADLSRSITALEQRLAALERSSGACGLE